MANRTGTTAGRVVRQAELRLLKQLLEESHRPVPAAPVLTARPPAQLLLARAMQLIAEAMKP